MQSMSAANRIMGHSEEHELSSPTPTTAAIQVSTLAQPRPIDQLSPEQLLDNSPVPTFVIDAQHVITHWNSGCEAVTGLSAEEMLGTRNQWRAFYDSPRPVLADIIVDGADEALISRFYEGKCRASNCIPGAFEVEDYFPNSPGKGRWLFFTAAPLKNEAGDIIGVIETIQDTTERKLAEQELQRLQTKLQERETLLHSSIETIGEAFVVYDEQDRLAFFNDEYRKLYQTSAPAIEIGRSFEEVIRYGAERGQYPAAVGRVEAWVAERLEQHLSGKTEIIQQTDNGRWLRIRERKLSNGHIVGFRVDVTEVYLAKEAAERANRAKSQFLATMSHEIRTPMNCILGMAQILLNPATPEADKQEYVRAILRSGQVLLTLLNDILDLSKIEAEKFELNSANFSPVNLVGETVHLFSLVAHEKQLAIRWESDLQVGEHYQGDAPHLKQVLFNLLSNAIKFSDRGEISVAVNEISGGTKGNCLEFSVSDMGQGIDADKLPLLFLPFSQIDGSSTRQRGGTGLGLSIVSKLAQLMGGEAGVETKPGHGSRFWFRIKAERASAQSATENSGRFTIKEVNAHIQLEGHVLVAEDDPTHRAILDSLLRKLGVTVTLVDDGAKAIAAVTAGTHFDLILMDISMPLINGIEATKQIRAWQKAQAKSKVPIVATTANAFDEDRQLCKQAGIDDFLPKPIVFDELLEKLKIYLVSRCVDFSAQGVCSPIHKVDIAYAMSLIEKLIPLLIAHKFDAFGQLKLLQAAVAGSNVSMEIDEIADVLKKMDFDHALLRLKKLAKRWGG